MTVSASAEGPAGWDVKATLAGADQAASTVVKAGATQNISVSAKPAAETAAGDYPITVSAVAGERTVTADLSIAVTGSYSMTVTTPGDLLSTRGSAGTPTSQAFTITNTGTAPLTSVSLTGTPPSGWTVTVDPADGLASLAPGASDTITATITPSSDAVAGDYVVTFNARSAEAPATGATQIRYTVETSPIWAIVGLVLIVLIVGGLLYVFRTYGRR